MRRPRIPMLVTLLGCLVLGAQGAAAADPTAGPGRWVPRPTDTFQYQLSGRIDLTVDATVFDLDAFETPRSTIRKIHASGRRAICYIDAGTWESYRPDKGRYPARILGKRVDGWPDERWVDIRRLDILKPIIRDRVDRCARKGFDGVEYDWTDSYLHDTGFPLTRAHQLTFDRWLAWVAHDRGLSVGLKNSGPIVKPLLRHFDFVVTEECFQYHECGLYRPFRQAGKAHFDVEYTLQRHEFCDRARNAGVSAVRKRLSLNAWRRAC
ncbi:MAG: endo alpha-1,4 polygalactosaminidase [Chloroflexi bacterium]|nr:endo alpha-1,4 polygalactosaminidase [Chloroflexota bacterium]